jgi:hypothetical protein
MIDPFVAMAMFSGPTIIASPFAVSAAEALSPLLHALIAPAAKMLSTAAARLVVILRSVLVI